MCAREAVDHAFDLAGRVVGEWADVLVEVRVFYRFLCLSHLLQLK